jgi:uracil-DNA glycosylase
VLLLNTVLTVRSGEAHAHKNRGWESFTDAVIESFHSHPAKIVFVLWGKSAQKKVTLINRRHVQLVAPHPSPLSSHRGFFGSRPFSSVNTALEAQGLTPIDWRLE